MSKYLGFKKLSNMIAKKGGAVNPGAIASAIARNKYGSNAVKKHAAAATSMKTTKHLKK